MTKRFKLFVGNNYGIQSADGEVISDSIISVGDAEVLCDLLNDLLNENEQLKKALLFYIDVALCETSSNFNKDFDNICNNLFGCSYSEIKHLYSDIDNKDDVFALFQR